MKKRKVIQIATAMASAPQTALVGPKAAKPSRAIYALCDDGTVWQLLQSEMPGEGEAPLIKTNWMPFDTKPLEEAELD